MTDKINDDAKALMHNMLIAYYRIMHPKQYDIREKDIKEKILNCMRLPDEYLSVPYISYAEQSQLLRELVNRKGQKRCKQIKKKSKR